MLTVHDELVVAHHPDDALDDVANAVQWAMEITMPGWVDTISEPGYGTNWNDIKDFVYPNRRSPGDESPTVVDPGPVAPTSSVMTSSPPLTDEDALTLNISRTMPKDLLEKLAAAFRERPGPTTLFVQVEGTKCRAHQGVQIDRPFLLQLRIEGIPYTITPGLEKRLLRT